MDFDVIVIGSGFGGAITGCRLAEAGYKVLILERGRRWTYEAGKENSYPRLSSAPDKWMWSHAHPERDHGWIDLRVFPTMSVAQGAGVGGGSLIYANISVEAPAYVFDNGWPPEITYAEIKPYYDKVRQFMKVRPLPANQFNGRTRMMQDAARAIGQPERFRLVEMAVNFDDNLQLDIANPPSKPAGPFPKNEHGVPQGTCYHSGMCDSGCDVNARNTLDTNYIPRAEKTGNATVAELHLVTNIEPAQGGYRVHFDDLHGETRTHGSKTARIVIVAASSLGSTELLLQCRDVAGTLPALSPRLGYNWASNGDFLTPAYYENRNIYPAVGPTIGSIIDFHDGSVEGQKFWIQDGGFPDVFGKFLSDFAPGRILSHVGTLIEALKHMVSKSPERHVMPWFAQGIDAGDGVLSLKRPWWFFGKRRLHLSYDVSHSPVFDTIVRMHERLSHATGGVPLVPPTWTLGRYLVTPHPLGGCNMGTGPSRGVVDHRGEAFGYKNLYVADAAIIPRPVGVNPSRTIAALAERIARKIVEEKR